MIRYSLTVLLSGGIVASLVRPLERVVWCTAAIHYLQAPGSYEVVEDIPNGWKWKHRWSNWMGRAGIRFSHGRRFSYTSTTLTTHY